VLPCTKHQSSFRFNFPLYFLYLLRINHTPRMVPPVCTFHFYDHDTFIPSIFSSCFHNVVLFILLFVYPFLNLLYLYISIEFSPVIHTCLTSLLFDRFPLIQIFQANHGWEGTKILWQCVVNGIATPMCDLLDFLVTGGRLNLGNVRDASVVIFFQSIKSHSPFKKFFF
jgi:hypothetical protein